MKSRTIAFVIIVLITVAVVAIWLYRDRDQDQAQSQPQLLSSTCLSLAANVAQSPGTDAGYADYEKYAGLPIPPLHPDEALDRFQLEEGFRIEVVAHEPMIVDPVAMDIDADGRLWVVEMPSYNMDSRHILETTDERTPEREAALRAQMPPEKLQGRVVILEDTNGDGKMDTHRVFLDELFRPRAIKVLRDGILLGEPPNLWFVRDTTGDGRGDTRELISAEFGEDDPTRVQSLPGALMWGMDNWIHASHGSFESIRRVNDQWQGRPFQRLGQWGISQDDWGRLYSSSNSWPLEANLVPYGYSERHPRFRLNSGKSERIAPHEPVWPAHAPATNRNYRIGIVAREDGSLKIAAGVSSTVIYRGDQFGPSYRGNAFTPITAGNLIKRLIIEDDPAEIEAKARFAYEGREFLTSTDERFRPVNIYNAPDGSLYVIDMYRGLFDYILWVTDHLRNYSLENKMYKPTGQFGRIYRIVRDDREIDYNVPRFSNMTALEITEFLRHENGHLRDLAQQILIQCPEPRVIPILEEYAHSSSAEAYTRLHALWTLEGFDREIYARDQLAGLALTALDDSHPRIRAAAVRILEPELAHNTENVLDRLNVMTEHESSEFVKLQLLASLGESSGEKALGMMARILNDHADSPYFREMALTGVYQREESFAGLLKNEYGWDDDSDDAKQSLLVTLSESAETRDVQIYAGLNAEQRERFDRGRVMYRTCMACHGERGQGTGVGSALAESDWVKSDPGALIRIVLNGFEGGVADRNEQVAGVMPGHAYLSDEDLAAILTFIRASWGNDASPIDQDQIREVRQATSERSALWTPRELRELLNE